MSKTIVISGTMGVVSFDISDFHLGFMKYPGLNENGLGDLVVGKFSSDNLIRLGSLTDKEALVLFRNVDREIQRSTCDIVSVGFFNLGKLKEEVEAEQ